MTDQATPARTGEPPEADAATERLLRLLAAAAFLVFFQGFMIAPLIPRLAQLFDASTNTVGLAVPAYLIPYGLTTLIWGPLSDRFGRRRVILGSLTAFVVLTAATAAVGGAAGFLAARIVTAVGASGVVPISLALIGDLFHRRRRGHALGWLFRRHGRRYRVRLQCRGATRAGDRLARPVPRRRRPRRARPHPPRQAPRIAGRKQTPQRSEPCGAWPAATCHC